MKIIFYNTLFKWNLVIQTSSSVLYDNISAMFSMILNQNNSDEFEQDAICDDIIDITMKDNVYVVSYFKCGLSYKYNDLKQVLYTVYEFILLSFNNCSFNGFALFHGGVIAHNNKCFAILAPTLTGKSTVIQNLCNEGYRYMGDDHTIYDINKNECISFPKPLSIRNLNYIYNSGKYIETIDFNNEKRFISYNCLCLPIGMPKQLDTIFFIERNDRFEFSAKDESSGIAYKKLLFSCRENSILPNNRRAAAKLSNSAKIVSVKYNNSSQFIDYFGGIINEKN